MLRSLNFYFNPCNTLQVPTAFMACMQSHTIIWLHLSLRTNTQMKFPKQNKMTNIDFPLNLLPFNIQKKIYINLLSQLYEHFHQNKIAIKVTAKYWSGDMQKQCGKWEPVNSNWNKQEFNPKGFFNMENKNQWIECHRIHQPLCHQTRQHKWIREAWSGWQMQNILHLWQG